MCYIFFALMLVSYAFAVKKGVGVLASDARSFNQDTLDELAFACDPEKPETLKRLKISAVVGLAVGAVNLVIFFSHCKNCNGWLGFFVTAMISIILYIFQYWYLPYCPPSSLRIKTPAIG